MKHFAVALVMIFAAMSIASAQNVTKKAKDRVAFSGKASVSAAPDTVNLNLGITGGTKKTASAAVSAQAKKSSALLKALETSGVADNCIATTSYTLRPVYQHHKDGRPRSLIGYVVNQSLHVNAPKEKASALIDTIAANAIINSVYFTVSDADEKREQAISLAITNAFAKAKKRAKELGIKLSEKPVAYTEYTQAFSMYRDEGGPRMARSAPQLPAGEATISASVQLTFEIVP